MFFSEALGARFLNTWCRLNLLARTETVIDYITDQQAQSLLIQNGEPPPHTLEHFIEFILALKEGAPYALVLCKKYPKILFIPAVTCAVLQNPAICRVMLQQVQDRKTETPIITTISSVFIQMKINDLSRIFKMVKESHPDCQIVLDLILKNSDVIHKICENPSFALQCVFNNISEKLSLSLCQNDILLLPDMIYLLKRIQSPDLVQVLINRTKVLLATKKSITEIDRVEIDVMLRLRQSMVDTEQECIGLPNELIMTFAQFYQTEGSVATLLQFQTGDFLVKNSKLVAALLINPETRLYYKRDILSKDQCDKNFLEVLLSVNQIAVWQLLENDPELIEKIRLQINLRKIAIHRNFNDKYTLGLLAITKLSPEEICDFLEKSQSDLVFKELLRKLGSCLRQVPITLLNETIYRLQAKVGVLATVAPRYEDVDHFQSLFTYAKPHELELLLAVKDFKPWQDNIAANINLPDLVNWIIQSTVQDVWMSCTQLFLLPKIHLILEEQETAPQWMLVCLSNLLKQHGGHLPLTKLILHDAKLKPFITFDLIASTLNIVPTNDCIAEFEKLKLDLVLDSAANETIPSISWVKLLHESNHFSLPIQLWLLACAVGFDRHVTSGKKTIDQLRLRDVILKLKEAKQLLCQHSLLQQIMTITQLTELALGSGQVQTPITRIVARQNVNILKLQLGELLDEASLLYWIEQQTLGNDELAILFSIALEKGLLTNKVMLAGMYQKQWKLTNFITFTEICTIQKLKTLLPSPTTNENDDDDAASQKEIGLGLTRIVLAQVAQPHHSDLEVFIQNERHSLLIFLADRARGSIFQMTAAETEKLEQTVTRLLACQKKCDIVEMLFILTSRPNLPLELYTRLKPQLESVPIQNYYEFPFKYYSDLLMLPLSNEIQADIIHEILILFKLSDDVKAVVNAFKPRDVKQLDPTISGAIARAILCYQNSPHAKQRPLKQKLVEVDEAKFTHLKMLVVALLDDSRFKLSLSSQPWYAAIKCNEVFHYYVDAAWIKPLLDIDRIILLSHASLRAEGWLISQTNPYVGRSPDTGEVETLPLKSSVADEINRIFRVGLTPPSSPARPDLQRTQSHKMAHNITE